MTPSKPSEAGFSLLEMLVGLTLLALISVAVTQSVRTGLRLWQAAQANDAESEWQQTEWLVERWLSRSLSPREFDVDSRLVFDANQEGIRFLVDGQVGRKPSGYSRIRLFARSNPVCPGKSDFVLLWEDVSIAGRFAPDASDERVLFECIDELTFDYRVDPANPALMAGSDLVVPAGELPRAVRIRLTAGGKPREIAARLRYAR